MRRFHLAAGLVVASNKIGEVKEDGKKKTDIGRDVELFEMILDLLPVERGGAAARPFIDSYYVPYFKEMKRLKHVETPWHIIHASIKKAALVEWVGKNQQRINDFMNWSAGFQWSKGLT